MLTHELILEYNREITTRNIEDQLFSAFARDSGNMPNQSVSLAKASVMGNYAKNAILKREGKPPVPLSPEKKKEVLNALLDAIEQSDPTTNKSYTPWLVKMYAKGNLKIEDMNRMGYLDLFDEAKRRRLLKPEHTDIGRFKTYRDFEDVMQYEYASKIPNKETTSKGKYRVVWEDDSIRVIWPQDEEAACYYGRGTRWCTAATKGENFFDTYNSSGPLYIILPKKPRYIGEKYQFHFDTNQFMDENDAPVGAEMYSLFQLYPGLMRVFHNQVSEWVIFASNKTILDLQQQLYKVLTPFVEDAKDTIILNDADYQRAVERARLDNESHTYEYSDYDFTITEFMENYFRFFELSPQSIRNIATDMQSDGEGMVHISEFDSLLLYDLESQHQYRKNSAYDKMFFHLSHILTRNIQISKNSKDEYIVTEK